METLSQKKSLSFPGGHALLTGRLWRGGLLYALLLLAFALRLYRAADQSLWADEIYSVAYAKMSFAEIIRFNIGQFDPHAPLFYLLLKAWTALAGQSELSFRFLGILFGVMAIPLIYWLGRSLASREIGLLAGFILVVNPFHIWYSQEVRTYSFTTLLALLSMTLFIKILKRETSPWVWTLYVLVTTLGFYSHYYSFLLVLLQNLVFFALRSRRRLPQRSWLISQAFLILPYLPWAQPALRLLLGARSEGSRTLAQNLAGMATQYSLGWFLDPALSRWLLVGFLLLAAVGLLAHLLPRLSRSTFPNLPPGERLLLLLAWLLLPPALALLFVRLTGRYLFAERYLIMITPAYYLLLATGLSALGRLHRLLSALGMIFLLTASLGALNLFYHDARFSRPDYRSLSRYVLKHQGGNDIILAQGDVVTRVVSHYLNDSIPLLDIGRLKGSQELRSQMVSLTQRYSRLWLLPYGEGSESPQAEDWLNRNAYKVENRWFATARVALYETQKSGFPLNIALDANLENVIRLRGYQLALGSLEAGQVAPLTLIWEALQDVEADYNVTLRLLDGQGHLVSKIDRRPVDGEMLTSTWHRGNITRDNYGLLVPPGTLTGLYPILVGMYERNSMQHLARLDEKGAPAGIWIELGPLRVTTPSTPPGMAGTEIAQRVDADFGSRVRLLGYGLLPDESKPGDTLSIPLYWQAIAPLEDLTFIGELVARDGTVVATALGSMANLTYTTPRWRPGEMVRDFLDLPLPAPLQSGTYILRLRVMAGSSELAPRQGLGVNLREIKLKARGHNYSLPQPQRPLSSQLGEWASLLGYDLSWKEPGRLLLTLYWRAEAETDTSYSVFTHLLDAREQLWGQHDGIPGAGLAPTSGWLPGEVIIDQHEIITKAGAPPGRYLIEVGLYDEKTGRRLRTSLGESRVLLGSISLP